MALSEDGERLYMGFGSDHPRGATVKQDLWVFELSTGVWTRTERPDGAPAGRGFAMAWEGPTDSLGVLAFGVDGDLRLHEDAFVLRE